MTLDKPIKFELVINEFENDAGRQARDKHFVGYGQIQEYINMTLPANPIIKIKEDVLAIITLVQMCNTNGEDASMKLIWYKNSDMEVVCAFNVATINCVIGQVKTRKWWGIVDHSAGPPPITICDIQEPEYESEDSFSISCSV